MAKGVLCFFHGICYEDVFYSKIKTENIQKSTFRPVLANDVCRWLVPRVDLAASRMDTIVATAKGDGFHQLSVSNSAYHTSTIYGEIYSSEDNGRLYFRNPSNEDVLVMDLSVSVNDTFITKGLYGEDIALIVDSVYHENDLKHIQFDRVVWNYANPVKCCFVEGFGPNWGFSRQDEYADLLVCKFEGDDLFYSLPDTTFFKNCTFKKPFDGWGITPAGEHRVSVYPNPTDGLIKIETDGIISDVALFNVLGRKVMSLNPTETKFDVDLTAFPGGVYFLAFTIDKHRNRVKIVKR